MNIYRINCTNGFAYIGSTSNPSRRWQQHKWDLKNHCHSNPNLQKAWDELGEDAFDFEVLEKCFDDDRHLKEQHWMDQHSQLFNIWIRAASRAGSKASEPARANMKRAANLRGITAETRMKGTIAAANKARGKKRDPRIGAKISAAQKLRHQRNK